MMHKILLLFFLTYPVAIMAQTNEHPVYSSIERLRIAMLQADKQELEALTMEQMTYGHSNGMVETRSEFIEAIVSRKSRFESIHIRNMQVQFAGDVAIVRHLLDGETNDPGKGPGQVHLAILQVWKSVSGVWKLLARQAVKVE